MIGKYTIIKLETKTTKIGNIISADLQDFNGTITDKVSIFPTFPNFTSLKVGSEVMGQITVKVNGQYTNKTLNEEKTSGYASGGARSVNMNKLMDKKAENIEKAQERKNDSIAFFNATNSAIEMVKQFHGDTSDIQSDIKHWRDWFLSEWHKYESDPTKGKSPF